MTRTVDCPTCGKAVAWTPDSADRPFCSERCRLIDLGEWASEGYRIPDRTPAVDADTSDADMIDAPPTSGQPPNNR